MKVQELKDKLSEFPPEREVVIFDTRMNCYNADGEGTSAGIYTDIKLSSTELWKYNADGVVDEDSDKYHVVSLDIQNETDYDKECNKYGSEATSDESTDALVRALVRSVSDDPEKGMTVGEKAELILKSLRSEGFIIGKD